MEEFNDTKMKIITSVIDRSKSEIIPPIEHITRARFESDNWGRERR